ncbi:hypothetical protein [Mucilaginibacter aquariorum]|uniref:Uncharacterized protein n=1 Tax=Mucilaginibacter aquariorum TaxID=2967225 RepID=A0ABT1T4E3_9SPHI|nr:hypothetical protein [Mucilaginibacter aquariorum]MCQ6958808.1 hypothetical protein [Mucilaginibacter aquariorum]
MKKLYPKSKTSAFKLCLILMTSVAVIYGCRKDISKIGEPLPLTASDPKIGVAKTWYETNFPKKVKESGQATHTIGDEFDLSQFFNPNWNNAKNYNRYNNDVIEIPIDSASKIALKIGSGESSQNNSRSSVLILKRGQSYGAYVMTIVGDADYVNGDASKLANNSYNKRDADFSGMVYYTTPQGKFVSGYTYKNGTIKGALTDVAASAGNQATQSIKTNLVQYVVCTSWYQLVPDDEGDGYHWIYLDQTNCHNVTSGDNAGIPPISGGGSTGPGGGSGSGGNTPTPPDYPCDTQNPARIKGGKSINAIKVQKLPGDGGGFPPVPPPGDEPCVVGAEHPIFGINNSNAVVPDANFNAMVDYLKGLGYKAYPPYEDFVNVNGVFYHGTVFGIISADGKDVVTYFKPDADGGTMTTGFYYSMGYQGPNGTNASSNSLSWPISMPSYFGSSTVIYTPPPAVIYTGNGNSYIDPATATTVAYTDVLSAFTNFPQIIDQIESGEPITGGPQIIMSKIGLLTSIDCLREVEVLTYQHPDWTKAQIYGNAFWNVLGGKVHFMLDVAGFVPVIGDAADLINGGIYFIEGNKVNCALSVAAAIPVVGWASTAGKWVKVSIKTVPLASAAGKVAYRAIKVGRELRLVKMAINVFDHAALITLKAIKPADKTLTNISGYLIDRFGLRIAPTESTLKNLVDDIVQLGDATGAKTEQLADVLLQRNGFVKYESKIGSNNGFDGVYIKGSLTNPTEIVINEAKQIGSAGNIKLTPGSITTGLAAQMSDAWISKTIDKMITNVDPATMNLGNVLKANFTKISKTVTAVDKSTKEIVVLKLDKYGL